MPRRKAQVLFHSAEVESYFQFAGEAQGSILVAFQVRKLNNVSEMSLNRSMLDAGIAFARGR